MPDATHAGLADRLQALPRYTVIAVDWIDPNNPRTHVITRVGSDGSCWENMSSAQFAQSITDFEVLSLPVHR